MTAPRVEPLPMHPPSTENALILDHVPGTHTPPRISAYRWWHPPLAIPEGAQPCTLPITVLGATFRSHPDGEPRLHVPAGVPYRTVTGHMMRTARTRSLTAADALALGLARLPLRMRG